MNICIIGNAGSGKSTAASIVAQYLSVKPVESDDLAHGAYCFGTSGWKAIVEHFGETILAADKSIDRAKLGDIIFETPTERDFLRSVVDPFVRERVREEFNEPTRLDEIRPHRILVSYLMIERKWFPESFHHVLVITSHPETCIERMKLSRGRSEASARSVLNAQYSTEEIIEEAKRLFGSRVSVIQNDDDLAKLEQRIHAFLISLLGASGNVDQLRWAEYLENESSHLLSIFIAEQQRASWFLALAGALLGVVVTNRPAIPVSTFSAFAMAILFLSLAVLFSLVSVYPVDGYKHLYGDLFGVKYRRMRNMSLDEFLREQARPNAWSLADYLLRVQYHYRSHWLISFRRKRMMAWATILTLAGVVCAAIHLLRSFI